MPQPDPPPPGSKEAIAAGCRCPVGANALGAGYMGGVKDQSGNVLYVMSAECPLHGGSHEDERKQ